jgi:gluconokinase
VHQNRPPYLVVVMGVAGAGKTTVGRALADDLGLAYADADDFHPQANVAKMAAGRPLEDADRLPWLRAVGSWLAEHPAGGVVSCSALRRTYRDLLREQAPGAFFLHLSGDPAVATARVAARTDHFMPASLVDSQFALLEPLAPEEAGCVADLAAPVGDVVAAAVRALAGTTSAALVGAGQ